MIVFRLNNPIPMQHSAAKEKCFAVVYSLQVDVAMQYFAATSLALIVSRDLAVTNFLSDRMDVWLPLTRFLWSPIFPKYSTSLFIHLLATKTRYVMIFWA